MEQQQQQAPPQQEHMIDKSYFTSLYKQIRLQEFLEVAHTILLDRLENGYGKTVKGVPLGCLPVELFKDHFQQFRSWRTYTKDRVTSINGEKVNVQHLYFTFNARSGFPTLSTGKEWVKKRVDRKEGDSSMHEYQKVTFIISYRDTRVECDFKMSSQPIGGVSLSQSQQLQLQQQQIAQQQQLQLQQQQIAQQQQLQLQQQQQQQQIIQQQDQRQYNQQQQQQQQNTSITPQLQSIGIKNEKDNGDSNQTSPIINGNSGWTLEEVSPQSIPIKNENGIHDDSNSNINDNNNNNNQDNHIHNNHNNSIQQPQLSQESTPPLQQQTITNYN